MMLVSGEDLYTPRAQLFSIIKALLLITHLLLTLVACMYVLRVQEDFTSVVKSGCENKMV